ncbi:MAG: DUF4124 domain-containing protein [Gammaproteobacteria bacterium]|nr:DUF4124 domain-containing protein [Gammaproteobacteria bacterium]
MAFIGLLASPLWSTGVLADTIYQSTGSDGSITFSDSPSEGAKEIKLKPITIYSAKEARGKPKTASNPAVTTDPKANDSGNYKEFTITSPANNTTLQTGDAGNTTIHTKIDPPLRVKKGHRLSALVDGGQLGYATSASSVGLSNLNRGTRSIRAVIINQHGDIVQLSSNSVTIHIKRASIFAPSNPRNPANQ